VAKESEKRDLERKENMEETKKAYKKLKESQSSKLSFAEYLSSQQVSKHNLMERRKRRMDAAALRRLQALRSFARAVHPRCNPELQFVAQPHMDLSFHSYDDRFAVLESVESALFPKPPRTRFQCQPQQVTLLCGRLPPPARPPTQLHRLLWRVLL
jgi:hypothetical protein